jgi:hypothetical protein
MLAFLLLMLKSNRFDFTLLELENRQSVTEKFI